MNKHPRLKKELNIRRKARRIGKTPSKGGDKQQIQRHKIREEEEECESRGQKGSSENGDDTAAN